MSDQIIYTILGENYILIEEPVTGRLSPKLKAKIIKYECIEQGIKDIHAGWFSGWAIAKILVPERNILKYNKE